MGSFKAFISPDGKALKVAVYHVFRLLGFFALARQLTAGHLRILCYHGLSLADEHLYSPGLFMRCETFRSRLETLRRRGYPVLPLEEALHRLRTGSLPPNATVITLDDGFYGNYVHGTDLARDFQMPMTLYVTTYYVVKQNPIFRHAVQYLFWKTGVRQLELEGLPGVDGGTLDLSDAERTRAIQWAIIEHAEARLSEPERVAVCQLLSQRLEVSYDELVASRRLSLMTPGEVRQLAALGTDIQLHTHRHHLPVDADLLRREVEDNRRVLEPAIGRACVHLCYPSGVFTPEQWPTLEQLGVMSATTCENGLNDASTPQYALKRFLDGENVRPIEFEAEICGFAEAVRSVRRLFRPDERQPGSNVSAHGR
jgi:peptidoglycan/xylan/chitin deacetylase (PgdA/CDA1 family)